MKGSITDLPVIIVGMFIISMSLFFSYYIFTAWNAAAAPLAVDNTALNITLTQADVAYSVWDASILFIAIAMVISSGISAYFLRTHPIFFIPTLIVWIISFVIAAIFSNIFAEFIGTSPLLAISTTLTNTVTVSTNYPILAAIFGIIIIIALYAKRRGDSGAQPY